jgi:hypothetical protein
MLTGICNKGSLLTLKRNRLKFYLCDAPANVR